MQPMMSDPGQETRDRQMISPQKDSFEFLTKQLAVLGGTDHVSEDLSKPSPEKDEEILSP